MISYGVESALQQMTGLPSGSEFPVGETINTYVLTDESGNTASCSFTITVNDVELPIIECPMDTMIVTSSGGESDCAGILEFSHPIPTDNCGTESYLVRYINPDGTEDGPFSAAAQLDAFKDTTTTRSFAIGTTTVEYVVTDPSGNSATCSFDVTVTDDEAPSFVNCPTDTLRIGNDVDNCDGGAIWSIPVAEDNCGLDTVVQFEGPAPGSILPIGLTEIAYEARDVAGNTDTCTFFIEVIDTQDPLLGCVGDLVRDTDEGECTWTSADGQLDPRTCIRKLWS